MSAQIDGVDNLSHVEIDDITDDVKSKNNEDTVFDNVIGHIEDIILGSFQSIQINFLEKHYSVFECHEENKLEYMEIFNEYAEVVEKHIENELKQRLPGFQMESFLSQIKLRESELDGEVFELLLSFTDFLLFKELMLDYKLSKEGKHDDLSQTFCVQSLKSHD